MMGYKVLVYDNNHYGMKMNAAILGYLQPQTKRSRNPKRSSMTTSRRCGSPVRLRLTCTSSTYVGGPIRSSCRSIQATQR